MAEPLIPKSLLDDLRRQAKAGASVPAMVRSLCAALEIEVGQSQLMAKMCFYRAFRMPPDVLFQLDGWDRYSSGFNPHSDDDIQRIMMPAILARMEEWDR